MTSLLILARDVLDQVGNPSFGVATNDQQAALLASVLSPEDVERFAAEVERLDSVAELTLHGWTWVLQFALGHRVDLGDRLLTALCRSWDEPAFKALVIEVAINRDGDDEPLSERSRSWLGGLVDLATADQVADAEPDVGDGSEEQEPQASAADLVDAGEAESLLVALMIVGTDDARQAARRLVNREWSGAGELASFVDSHRVDPDPLTRSAWEMLQNDEDGVA